MIGERFGRLVVIALVEGRTVIRCLCDCGVEKTIRASSLRLRRGTATRSCGCYRKERMTRANLTHGETPRGALSTEWITWRSMRQRCADPNHKSYADYGGRGITVCAKWIDSFEQFLTDMGRKPRGAQIERVDNSKGYSKENCIWATRSEQARNRREHLRLRDGTYASRDSSGVAYTVVDGKLVDTTEARR